MEAHEFEKASNSHLCKCGEDYSHDIHAVSEPLTEEQKEFRTKLQEVENTSATKLEQIEPQTKARSFVFQWAQENALDSNFNFSNVKVVWFSKTLQNWKAIIAIIGTKDQFLFEVTYNGDKEETYLDAYTKLENVRIPD